MRRPALATAQVFWAGVLSLLLVMRWVDHLFNRSRHDADRAVEVLLGSVRERVDPDELAGGWVGVVDQMMQPGVGVWVR